MTCSLARIQNCIGKNPEFLFGHAVTKTNHLLQEQHVCYHQLHQFDHKYINNNEKLKQVYHLNKYTFVFH